MHLFKSVWYADEGPTDADLHSQVAEGWSMHDIDHAPLGGWTVTFFRLDDADGSD
jgi:hypothetical protein